MGKGLALLIVLAASLPAAAGELYRWVDDEGKVHFGDRPPLEAKAEAVGSQLKPLNRADAPRQQTLPDRHRADQIERDYQDQKRQQLQSQQRQRQAACSRAQRSLRILKGPVYFVDAEGNKSTISEREREQRARELEAQIRQSCG
ncbi:DUF4124 domain-containing protein [Microbulbifer sp. SA54]|uniref:DUF4124 domain-containing protein n=1 Tax=Microbulbifer sp. SA54 TaxID=3401577 RepID=UPI003AB02F7E